MSLATATTKHLRSPQGSDSSSQEKVLLIDDNFDLCGLMRQILELEDYIVTSVTGQDDLEAVIEDASFDLVICDLHLGKQAPQDGLELMHQLAQRGVLRRGLIITGDPRGIETQHLPHNCGLLLKPFRAGELLAAIH